MKKSNFETFFAIKKMLPQSLKKGEVSLSDERRRILADSTINFFSSL
jgi:hypothetical protein